MPCIQTKVNVSISPETEKSLKEKLGQAITLIPGKWHRTCCFCGSKDLWKSQLNSL